MTSPDASASIPSGSVPSGSVPSDSAPSSPTRPDRFVRPASGGWIAGVCAGIALRFGWNVTLVRLVTAIVTLFTAVPLFVYLAFWIAVPRER